MTTFEERWGIPRGAALPADVQAVVGSAYGRKPATSVVEAWRTGTPGRLTAAEAADASRVAFAPEDTQQRWREKQQLAARVAETRRQVAIEREALRLASERGWDWLKANTDGQEATVVESVRKRLGGGTAAQLQEAAGAALVDAGVRTRLTEATRVAPTAVANHRILVTLITPGLGSSGYYPAETLQQAAKDRVFGAGLQLFLDHPTVSEQRDRPERSVRDLAGVLSEDARWTGSALVAEARLLPQHADLLAQKDVAAVIGMSIRAQGDVEQAQVDGQRVRKVVRLVAAESCDFVTKAGRGGRYEVLESERTRWGW